ncbi:MAG TPA: helix-turn-helix domain-containing protein [Blastocatellia bacterium]|nr:helix-turn-helix domain-containing protein [Blastocatellia bacterium]
MPSLGEELKRRREERGIGLAEISEATRIGTRFLKAIDEGNFGTLPGGIFTRSFIRAYAKSVGMDEDEAIILYQQHIAEQTGTLPLPTLPIDDPVPRRAKSTYLAEKSRWPFVIVVLAIVIVVGLIVILASHRGGASPEDRQAQSSPSPSASDGTTAASPDVHAGAPSAESSPKTADGVAETQQPSAHSDAAVAPSVPSGEPISVSVEATTGDAWVSYQVDDAKSVAFTLAPGESKVLPPAHDRIKLNFGNRTTLKLKIDNKEASFPADTPNFASSIIISQDNLQSFFKQP